MIQRQTFLIVALIAGACSGPTGNESDAGAGRDGGGGVDASRSEDASTRDGGGSDASPAGDAALGDSGAAGSDASVAALLQVTPSVAAFGPVDVGVTSAPIDLVIHNAGSGPTLALGANLTGDASFAIAADGCSGGPLDASADCTVTIAFTPRTQGALTGSLEIAEGGAAPSLSIPLSGTGTRSCSDPVCLVATPSTVPSFGFVAVGDSSSVPITITNTGPMTSGVLGASVLLMAGGGVSLTTDTCTGNLLAEAEHCTLELTYAPTTATGSTYGQLYVASGGMVAITMNFTGSGWQPTISVNPIQVAWLFLSEPASWPASQDLTVSNPGPGDIASLSVALMGTSDVIISSDTCSTGPLPNGASCTLQLQWSPPSTRPASTGGTLAITPMFGSRTSINVSGLVN